MSNAEIYQQVKSEGQAELTGRLIPDDPDFDYPEWEEAGTLDGVPVAVFYRTTPEDEEMVEENGGDWGGIDWIDRIDRIEVDMYRCDQAEIKDAEIEAVIKQYGLDK